MNIRYEGYHEMTESEINLEILDPAFRKATSNMIAAHAVCQKTLAGLTEAQKKSLSFIVATHFGEVSSSLEFLTTLKESKMAKPILFQNSLHNSTLGFVSIQLGLTGPCFTLSADEKTDEAVANTAEALLPLTENVMICYVDMIPAFLKENYAQSFPSLSLHLGWARSVVICKDRNSHREIKDFSFNSIVEVCKKGVTHVRS